MKNTEFGPKINVGLTEGFVRADQIAFNAFNESEGLIDQVEGYRTRFGYYPGRVLADKIYWTHTNRKWLKARKIDIGGVSVQKLMGFTFLTLPLIVNLSEWMMS